MTTTTDDLRSAADLLDEFGWTQRKMKDYDTGDFCARGALLEAVEQRIGHKYMEDATQRTPWASTRNVAAVFAGSVYAALSVQDGLAEATEAFACFLSPRLIQHAETVVQWNDDPATTQELVVKTLRACADALDDIEDHR